MIIKIEDSQVSQIKQLTDYIFIGASSGVSMK
jgi:hypothetical protein